MDTMAICDLAVLLHVGVPEEERARPQRLLVTIEMALDLSAAAATDDLRQTIDYYAVSQRVIAFGQRRSWKLIETLAVDVAEMVRAEFGAKKVTVEVKKFIIPETRYVAVRVTRPN